MARRWRGRLVHKVARPLPVGLQQALWNLYLELETALAHARGEKRASAWSQASRLRLHLGCGNNYKEGWVNVDLGKKADVTLDLRRDLPFPDSCCSAVYSEHFLEHLAYPQAQKLLDECYRLLESGGTFSVAVPDGEMVLNAYVFGGSEEFYEAEARWHPGWCETRMEHLNYAFRQDGEHQFYYDFETLSRALQKAGFEHVRRRPFQPNLDQEERRVGSLYVECDKPRVHSVPSVQETIREAQ